MHPLTLVCLFGSLVFYLYAVRCLRHLVDCEYSNHHEQWLKDGKPGGGYATKEDAPWLLRGIPGGSKALEWLLATPEWAKGDQSAVSWLRRVRSCAVVSLLFYALFFLLLS